jgi:asparagine synthase (glutamine-hydrolysing)
VSGFAGIIRMEPTLETAEADRAAITRMAEAIAFRGPDAQRQFSRDGASFAFSLLTTGPAPQAAEQPVTLDGETFFLGEARIDGRYELIAKLQQHGAVVSQATTDEQLVLHFVANFGIEALPELDGDFSFVLSKARERRLFAFRDLSGARPFFYSKRGSQLVFSNTLQAILLSGNVGRREYDQQFIANFLLGAPHYDAERTIYRDVRRLPAGNLLEFSSGGVSSRPIARYPIEELLSFRRDGEVLEEFRRLFVQAIRDRIPESETTILLSGGLDSTSIAAAAVAHRKNQTSTGNLRLSASTLDFYPLFQDEDGPLAQDFAASLDLPCQVIHQAHILPLEGADEAPLRLPEPYDCPYPGLQPFYVSQFRVDSRVVLTGDGGDETLRAQAAPFLRHVVSRSGKAHAASLLLHYVLSRRRLPALGAGLRTGFLRLMGKGPAPPPDFPAWIEPAFETTFAPRKRFSEISEWPSSAHPHHTWSYGKLVRFIPPVMEGQDAMFSGRPVEARAPFLDRRLIRFLLRLPPIPWCMEKELLRRAQRGILPDKIRLHPKMPLQYDPLQLHIAAGKWSPGAPDVCPPTLQDVVDWPRLTHSLTIAHGTELYVHLRPVLLALWLNAVEKSGVIQ